MERSDDTLELGGNIRLSGFRDLDGGSMIIVKKIVGSYARRISEVRNDVQQLALVLKTVHQQGTNAKYEIQGKIICTGEHISSDFTDKNLFVALDAVLKKMTNMIQK